MYGLKQAAILAYNNLKKILEPYGYRPVPNTMGLWQHDSRPTKFCLCVDDFGVKYFSNQDLQHLLNALRSHYTVTTDTTGKNFCGLTMDWNYAQGFCDISMPGYIPNTLSRFQHPEPTQQQYSPHHYAPITFGPKGTRQYANKPDESALLNKQDTKLVQSITGSLLYYARAIDSTMLQALNEIASQQACPTQYTLQKCRRLLDYATTYPNAKIRFYASDMTLHVDSDAAYLVLPKARSRIAGHYSLGTPRKLPTNPIPNGSILIECKTLRHVVASAAEAEVGGLFHNAQMAIPIRNMLEQLGHPQPPTPIKTDNSTADSFVHDNIHLKRSKSWDMRFYWLRDRTLQSQFKIFWKKGSENEADYFTKHHPTAHHKLMRKRYVINQMTTNINTSKNNYQRQTRLRGCVDTLFPYQPSVTSAGRLRPLINGLEQARKNLARHINLT